MSGRVVAIDGPAASGKSTTARLVAERLGHLYLDTGAMYRAITWKALQEGTDLTDEEALGRLAASTDLDLAHGAEGTRVVVDDRDVTGEIRDPEISRTVSLVARVPAVRREMVRLQRGVGQRGDVVVEGRDIGTVVFPDAEVKVFLVASLKERARRRSRELASEGVVVPVEELMDQIRKRDALDSDRLDSPLCRAEDAVPLDTTKMTIEEQVLAVVEIVRQRREAESGTSNG
ncbi:MAG: (d)CMP kinase [Gemmatimonadota bacterium]|jgi:cytidylate kinase|nr:cytidylate kinase [Gemmatimonadota bacterium]MDP6529989.1 (d)CMP kinase [Gemmatimonadota bacterium]MDP6802106.1 (d)CMP kinase [Gemmatimonadota bacterium]MDP7032040.1 (d)CMP kinase [Gemmatimonadota bacterium]